MTSAPSSTRGMTAAALLERANETSRRVRDGQPQASRTGCVADHLGRIEHVGGLFGELSLLRGQRRLRLDAVDDDVLDRLSPRPGKLPAEWLAIDGVDYACCRDAIDEFGQVRAVRQRRPDRLWLGMTDGVGRDRDGRHLARIGRVDSTDLDHRPGNGCVSGQAVLILALGDELTRRDRLARFDHR